MAESISIIIPSWNGRDLLESNLPSVLAACKSSPAPVEIIVIDDGSRDGTPELLRVEFPQVRVLTHSRNHGFGRACASGAGAASGEVLIFLNNDVQVDPDFIGPLLEPLREPSCFASVPLVLDHDGIPLSGTLAIPYLRRGKIRYRRTEIQRLLEPAEERKAPWYTLYPVGAAFAVRGEHFLELGGFDELFEPFYYEDVDLGLRAWRRGWSCRVVPESRVWHLQGATIARSFNGFRVRAIRKRNRFLLLTKHLTSRGTFLSHPVHQCLGVLYRTLRLDFPPLVGFLLALPRLPLALSRREEERASAELSLEEILSTIEAAWNANTECEPSRPWQASSPG